MKVLVIGCGYVGLPLGAEMARQGHEVFGLRRGAAADLPHAGITPLTADISDLSTLAPLPSQYDWVVNCVASSGGGAADYRRVYLEGTRNILQWLAPHPPRKFVYTSSTSVYAQNDGSTVDEASETAPAAETGKVLVETERLLVQAAREQGFPAVVLRLAGIYGPGRGYWFRQFLAGEAVIEGRGDRVLNMIHRDDVIGAILAALERGRPGEVYNAADNEPVTQLGFFKWLAEKRSAPLPPSVPENPDALRRRGASNKRVSNRKLREELGYGFKYPTFREGYEYQVNSPQAIDPQ